jgi:hypothetical protein
MESKHSKNGWDRIGGVRSVSKPAEQYVVALRTTGYLGCSCKSWIFKKGTMTHDGFANTCKHIRSVLDESVPLKDLDLTPFGVAWLDKRRAAKKAAQEAAALAKVG